MLSLPELLRRFGRAWAPPGPALARVGPPIDAAGRLRAELQPLLAVIATLQRDSLAIRSAADAQATALLRDADRRAEATVRAATGQAPAARAAATEQTRQTLDAEIASGLCAADAEVHRITTQSEQRIPELIANVRACVLRWPGAPS